MIADMQRRACAAVEKHIKHIFTKLEIPATPDTHRRVLAIITFLEAR